MRISKYMLGSENYKIEPPIGLFEKIMNRIHKEERLLVIKRRIVIFSIGLVGSLSGFIPAFKMARIGFIESGFFQFSSLIFSDFSIVMAYWQSFAAALLETLPIMSIIVLLGILFVFLESLKYLTKNIKLAANNWQLTVSR